jgi:hypothetical protein
MSVYTKQGIQFKSYLEEYVKENGIQTPLQVKQLAKNLAIQSRNGVYDLTARKRYCSLFISYCWQNNIEIPFEGLPAGWADGIHVCWHDPDSEFTDDAHVQKLIGAADKRYLKKLKGFRRYMINNGHVPEE